MSCTLPGKEGVFNASVPETTQGDSAVKGNMEEVRQSSHFVAGATKYGLRRINERQ